MCKRACLRALFVTIRPKKQAYFLNALYLALFENRFWFCFDISWLWPHRNDRLSKGNSVSVCVCVHVTLKPFKVPSTSPNAKRNTPSLPTPTQSGHLLSPLKLSRALNLPEFEGLINFYMFWFAHLFTSHAAPAWVVTQEAAAAAAVTAAVRDATFGLHVCAWQCVAFLPRPPPPRALWMRRLKWFLLVWTLRINSPRVGE